MEIFFVALVGLGSGFLVGLGVGYLYGAYEYQKMVNIWKSLYNSTTHREITGEE